MFRNAPRKQTSMATNADPSTLDPDRPDAARSHAAAPATATSTTSGVAAVSVDSAASRAWLMPFVGGLAVGVALSVGVGFLVWPATVPMSDTLAPALGSAEDEGPVTAPPPAGETERAAAPAQQPSAAEAEPSAPSEPSAAAAQPMPAVSDAVAAAAPSANNAAPARAPQPSAAAAQPAVAAAQAKVVTAAAAAVSAAPQPSQTPAAPAAPADPESQDAKLAAAAQVHGHSGTTIDNMLDQALTPQAKRETAAKPATPGVPATPSRDDVMKSMGVLVPAIRGCAQGASGLATVAFVVRNDGRVESAAVSGAPFEGTASGRCMEGVVRRARFSRFTQPSVRMQFPFAIQ